jgi:hypothetical protein
MPHVVLTYDLHGAHPVVYQRLNAKLVENRYTKAAEDTTWEAVYVADASVDVAVATTKQEFDACAQAAGATNYNLKVYGSVSAMRIATAKKP